MKILSCTQLLSRAQFHGAKRLADKQDRTWWAVFLLTIILCALATLVSAIWRYQSNPTYLARTGSNQVISPFPCVLICPEILYPINKVDALIQNLTLAQGMNVTWLRHNMYLLAAFYSPDIMYSLKDLETFEYILEYNDLNLEEVTRNLTPTCEEILIRCRWRHDMVRCEEIFKMELTTYGYCCVFNGRSLQREMSKSEADTKQRETKWVDDHVGFTNGLMVAIDQSQQMLDDVDLTYKWVTIQLSQQYVECSYNGTPIAMGTEQWIGFGGEDVQIADDARQLSYSLRKCRFSYEPLEFFPVYSKAYCNLECSMRRSISRCKCIPMTYPRPHGVSYCRARSLNCARGAAVPYGSDKCECPRECDQAGDFTVIQSYDIRNDTVPYDSFYHDLTLEKISVIRVFIPSHHMKTFSRRSVFSSISLFSQMGGVFNVFFGCSVLTLLEAALLLCRALCGSWSVKRRQPRHAIPPALKEKQKTKFRT